jgi:hypothetical protein
MLDVRPVIDVSRVPLATTALPILFHFMTLPAVAPCGPA